jgi:carboxypeptidase PM20D1
MPTPILITLLGAALMVHPRVQDTLLTREAETSDSSGRHKVSHVQRMQPEQVLHSPSYNYPSPRPERTPRSLRVLETRNGTNDRSPADLAMSTVWPLFDLDSAVSRFSEALRFQTISWDRGIAPDSTAFRALHDYIERSFPLVHATLERETVAGLSLLFTWPGSDMNLLPVLLMAHQDVVPADDEQSWTYPPFSGIVADGYIWGRGTLDNKQSLMALLEAVEQLIVHQFEPTRTVYISFGHDEEIGGPRGAKQISELLESRGITLETVIDEGGIVLSDFLRRSPRPVAAIGVGEKGSISLELRVSVDGGHSSMPVNRSAIGTLARAVGRVEHQRFRATLSGVPRETLRALAPTQSVVQRLMLSNMWLFRPIVVTQLSRTPETNAMIRTTVAPTTISAGFKANALPSSATATINFRTMPGETLESIAARVRRAINDSGIQIHAVGEPRAASEMSPTDTRAYATLSHTIRDVHPGEDVLVVPYLVPGGTDSRHFARITATAYRFTFIQLSREEAARFHGVDERLPLREYERLIKGYYRLIKGLQQI